MVTRTYTLNIDNIQFILDKQDRTNTDELELILPENETILVNDEVIIKLDASTTIFKGLVQNLKEGNGRKKAVVWDYGSELLQRTVNKIYNNQSPEAIIQDVLTNYSSLTYVSSITSGTILNTYVANKKRAWDIISDMAELLLANFRVDQDKNFVLELEGDSTITTKSIETPNTVLEGEWKTNAEQIVNSVFVDGDDRQIFEPEPEFFDGTGTEQTYELSEIPVALRIENPVGTVKKGFVEGASTGAYTLDRENKKFTGTFSVGTGNIKAVYSAGIPVSSRRRDAASILTYGQRDKVFKKQYIKTRSEARKFAEYVLNRQKDPILESTWILPTSEVENINIYLPNKYIYVNDTINNKSGYFIIRKIYWEFPGYFKITVGTPIENIIFWQKEVQQKVKQLEEKDDNSTILNEDEYIEEKITMQWDVDVVDMKKRTYFSDTFYLSENPGDVRNQMKDDGTGPVMREDGPSAYTETEIDSYNSFLITQAGDNLITQAGDFLITSGDGSGFTTVGVVPIYFQELARTNLITSLNSLITHMGTGDDNTAPLVTDTTLGNETIREALFDVPTIASNSISFSLFLDTADNNGNDIKEIGTFNQATGGILYTRSLTNVINKTSSIEVFAEVKIQIDVIMNGNLIT